MTGENPYKDKVVSLVNRTNSDLEKAYQEKEEYLKLKGTLESRVLSLNDSMLLLADNELVKEAITDSLDKCNKELLHTSTRLSRLVTRIKELQENLKFIKHNVCPHVEYEYDSTDYHKNEEYNKCKLCGYIF